MLAVSALFGLLFMRWNFPAALLLGGVVVSIATHVTGFVSGGVPDWLLVPTYVILGSVIGTRFCGVSITDLRTAFVAGGVVTVVVIVLAAAIAGGVSYLTGVPLDAALIAFAPGGLETMSAMAVMLHADPTYVGAHHVLRLMFLSVLMPIVLGKDARQR
jgi:membrane AbrB-like protein